jgi:hypothetical protein
MRQYLLSDALVMTRKLFAVSILAIPSPMSPIESIPIVAKGEPCEPIFASQAFLMANLFANASTFIATVKVSVIAISECQS